MAESRVNTPRTMVSDLQKNWDSALADVLADWCEERMLFGMASRLREAIADDAGHLAATDLKTLAAIMDETARPDEFGAAVTYYRERAGWSREMLAKRVTDADAAARREVKSVSTNQIALWEVGKSLPREPLRRALTDIFPRLMDCDIAAFENREQRQESAWRKSQETRTRNLAEERNLAERDVNSSPGRVAYRRYPLKVGDRVRDLNFNPSIGDRIGTIESIPLPGQDYSSTYACAEVWWDAEPGAQLYPDRFMNARPLYALVPVEDESAP